MVGAHGVLVHEQNRQFRERMDPELIEGKAGKSDQGRIVSLDARLVADVDAHVRAPRSGRIITAIA